MAEIHEKILLKNYLWITTEFCTRTPAKLTSMFFFLELFYEFPPEYLHATFKILSNFLISNNLPKNSFKEFFSNFTNVSFRNSPYGRFRNFFKDSVRNSSMESFRIFSQITFRTAFKIPSEILVKKTSIPYCLLGI